MTEKKAESVVEKEMEKPGRERRVRSREEEK